MDRNRGPIATVLIQNGTLNLRDYVVAGATWGRVRAMQDDKGRKLRKAEPSTPAEILGLTAVPQAGDTLVVAPDETTAKEIAEQRARVRRFEEAAQGIKSVSLDDLFAQIQAGKVKELRIILKADVQGSLEAISQTLAKLSTDDVKVTVLHKATGGITESDVALASPRTRSSSASMCALTRPPSAPPTRTMSIFASTTSSTSCPKISRRP